MYSLFLFPHNEALFPRYYCKFSWIKIKTIDSKQISNTPLTYRIYTIKRMNSSMPVQQTYFSSSLYLYHFEVFSLLTACTANCEETLI